MKVGKFAEQLKLTDAFLKMWFPYQGTIYKENKFWAFFFLNRVNEKQYVRTENCSQKKWVT